MERLNLQNNNLNGTLEWLPSLVNLREVYLQNNKLNGDVEWWLYDLQNLQELNIANNNFSGVFPHRLLLNCSLKLNYSGNPYLRVGKRECNLDKKNRKENMKLMVVVGILFIALMVDKFVKLRIKFYSTESKHFLNQGKYYKFYYNWPTILLGKFF